MTFRRPVGNAVLVVMLVVVMQSHDKNSKGNDTGLKALGQAIETKGEQIWNIAIGVGAVIFVLILGYFVTLFLQTQMGADWKPFVKANFSLIFGVPLASVAAFGLVVFFHVITPGPIEMKALGFELKGPAGQLLMWVVVFLSFILAIKLLRVP
jgi:hypothetical protein